MSRTSWPSLAEDAVSTAAAVKGTHHPRTTGVIVDSSINWKTLMLGVFVIAGVTGESHARRRVYAIISNTLRADGHFINSNSICYLLSSN